MRVLLVEDDARLAREIASVLRETGHVVDITGDGEEAWFLGDTEDYAAVVLDLGLPGMDGLSVLRRWREAGREMPVLVLSARGSWMERVEGIDAGADDYLPKPFEMEELLARLRAIIRRSAGQAAPVLEVGPVRLDTRQMKVMVRGRPVALSPQEYRLVAYLMHHAGRVVPREELCEHLYGDCGQRDSYNAMEVLIGRVRRKLGVDVIHTRRGFGYIMGDDGAADGDGR